MSSRMILNILAPFVLGHRMILQMEARMDGVTVASVLGTIFEQVRVPVRLEK